MAKTFASRADLAAKKISFAKLSAHDEARSIEHPRIWTAKRDIEMRKSLEIWEPT